MFWNLILLLFWSYVGSIEPNLKVPIFPNLEYIFQSPEKIFLWSPLWFFLHFSKRTVEGTIYWQNTGFFTKNQSPDRISLEFGTFKSRKFRSLVMNPCFSFIWVNPEFFYISKKPKTWPITEELIIPHIEIFSSDSLKEKSIWIDLKQKFFKNKNKILKSSKKLLMSQNSN
jgi:hypothetical protein